MKVAEEVEEFTKARALKVDRQMRMVKSGRRGHQSDTDDGTVRVRILCFASIQPLLLHFIHPF